MQGFLLVNKPAGITSFGVCARLRKLTGIKRIGHTGTLDPMATGVLGVFIGRATVLCDLLLKADKRYTAKVRLGVATDTDDITGKVIKSGIACTDMQKIAEVVQSFKGEQTQIPPAYSAIKQDGVALYKLARKGEDVKVPERQINIYEINILSDIDKNFEFYIDVVCSKGTYIRSLCRDIGEALGCYATLAELKRTETSGFCLDDCIELDALNSENIWDNVKSADTALLHLNAVNVTEKQAVRFSNGGALDLARIKHKSFADSQLLRVKCNDSFLGLGRVDLEKNELAVKCVIEQYNYNQN